MTAPPMAEHASSVGAADAATAGVASGDGDAADVDRGAAGRKRKRNKRCGGSLTARNRRKMDVYNASCGASAAADDALDDGRGDPDTALVLGGGV